MDKIYFSATVDQSGHEAWSYVPGSGIAAPLVGAETILGPLSGDPLEMTPLGSTLFWRADHQVTTPQWYRLDTLGVAEALGAVASDAFDLTQGVDTANLGVLAGGQFWAATGSDLVGWSDTGAATARLALLGENRHLLSDSFGAPAYVATLTALGPLGADFAGQQLVVVMPDGAGGWQNVVATNGSDGDNRFGSVVGLPERQDPNAPGHWIKQIFFSGLWQGEDGLFEVQLERDGSTAWQIRGAPMRIDGLFNPTNDASLLADHLLALAPQQPGDSGRLIFAGFDGVDHASSLFSYEYDPFSGQFELAVEHGGTGTGLQIGALRPWQGGGVIAVAYEDGVGNSIDTFVPDGNGGFVRETLFSANEHAVQLLASDLHGHYAFWTYTLGGWAWDGAALHQFVGPSHNVQQLEFIGGHLIYSGEGQSGRFVLRDFDLASGVLVDALADPAQGAVHYFPQQLKASPDEFEPVAEPGLDTTAAALPMWSFGNVASNPEGNPGGAAGVIEVTLKGDPAPPHVTTVRYQLERDPVSLLNAAGAADLLAQLDTVLSVTFAPGDATTIRIELVADGLAEGDEGLRLRIVDIDGSGWSGALTLPLSIVDDDPRVVAGHDVVVSTIGQPALIPSMVLLDNDLAPSALRIVGLVDPMSGDAQQDIVTAGGNAVHVRTLAAPFADGSLQSVVFDPQAFGSTSGVDQFDYIVEDDAGNRGRATVKINATNAAPIALADRVTAIAVASVGLTVPLSALLSNDSDPDGDALTLESWSAQGSAGGTLESWLDAGGQLQGFIYKPVPGINSETFGYTIHDSGGSQVQMHGRASGLLTVTRPPQVSFGLGSKNAVLEGSGDLLIVLARDGDLSEPSTVHYQFEPDLQPKAVSVLPGEYSPGPDLIRPFSYYLPYEVHFAAGVSQVEVRVALVNDSLYEADETFYMRLVDGAPADPLMPLTIVNDDPTAPFIVRSTTPIREATWKLWIGVQGGPDAGGRPGAFEAFQMLIDWGDGTTQTITGAEYLSVPGSNLGVDHRYSEAGPHTITVSGTDWHGNPVPPGSTSIIVREALTIGNAPPNGTPGQWATAWTSPQVQLFHKSFQGLDMITVPVSLNAVNSGVPLGGDIYGGLLGASGRSRATSAIRQEIDGAETLTFVLNDTRPNKLSLDLARLFINDDGVSGHNEAVRVRFGLDGGGVVERDFVATQVNGDLHLEISGLPEFRYVELSAGASTATGFFSPGGMRNAAGELVLPTSTHGSDFMVRAISFDYEVAPTTVLVGVVDADGNTGTPLVGG